MCMLCDDEKAYQAYMDYLDEMKRQGVDADPDKAMDALIDKLTREAAERNDPPPFPVRAPGASASRPASPFSCDPIEK